MSQILNLNRTTIDGLPLPANGQRLTYQDDRCRGLYLRVTEKGVKSWVVRRRVNGRDQRVTIGQFPDLSPELARKEAQRIIGEIATGADPNAEARRRKTGGTVAAIFADWLAGAKLRGNKSTWHDEDRFRKHLTRWADRSPETITRADVRAWHREMGQKSGPVAANRAAELLRRLYRYGARYELLTCTSPTEGLEWFPEEARDRPMMSGEFELFAQALRDEPNQDLADMFRLLLMTGQRLSPVTGMRWPEVDIPGRVWRIPGEKQKNGKPQAVHLIPEAVAILERRRAAVAGEWVFPSNASKSGHLEGGKTAWARILKRAGITGLRRHDLRHTFASLLTDDGASTKQVGQAVGHKDQRSTNRYQHASIEALRPVIDAALAPVSGLLRQASPDGEG